MRTLPRVRGARAGLSLLEMVIAASLVALVLSSVALVGSSSDNAYRTAATTSALESQAASTVERIVAELRTAGSETLVVDPATPSSFTYSQAVGLDGSDIVWTPTRRVELAYEIGEVDDGLDNNGNGLIDEGRVLLTEDPGGPAETKRVLTRWVTETFAGELQNGIDDNGNGLIDEPGFAVAVEGETLVIHLSMQKRSADGRILTRTAHTAARLRN